MKVCLCLEHYFRLVVLALITSLATLHTSAAVLISFFYFVISLMMVTVIGRNM